MCPGKSRAGQSEAKMGRNTNAETVNRVWWTAAVKPSMQPSAAGLFLHKTTAEERKEPKFELFETMRIEEGQETSFKWYLIF